MNYSNLTMLTDFYQLTMSQCYFKTNKYKKQGIFDLFFRKPPSDNGYAICCGLAQVVEYIKNLKFYEDDINYLRSLNILDEEFLKYLKTFKFTGDIHAIKEGSVVFPNEPLIRVKAPIIEAQIIETSLLNIINHQSLIATKASRVVWAANGDKVLEFGLRRAQGPDAGIYGSRASIIGGCHSTSNVLASKMFNIPLSGTHAHSWVMSFDDELSAFEAYAKVFPDKCILLVDTYNTLKSGVPNAIKVFDKIKKAQGFIKDYGIRIDSGDFSYLSSKAREMLNNAGHKDALICASSDLDEIIISSLKQQGCSINLWGVGTSLITSKDCPAFGGVYKLVAEEDEYGNITPKIKISENPEKVTTPAIKQIHRLYDKNTNRIKADLITLDNEEIDCTKDLTIFDPITTWKKMTLKANEYYSKKLLEPIFIKGKCVYKEQTALEIREYCTKEKETLWNEHKRLINPHIVPIDLSEKLYNLKKEMLDFY